MPVGEIRVGYRRDTNRMRGIADVEQESVAFTRPAGQADRRVDGDVVTLRRSGTRASTGRWLTYHLGDDSGKSSAQRRAVRTSGRASSTTRLDDAVQLRVDELRRQHSFTPENERRVAAFRASGSSGGLRFSYVLGRFTVSRGRDQIIEDARRADDRRLLGMGERNLDDCNAEERRVWILVGRQPDARGELGRRAHAR